MLTITCQTTVAQLAVLRVSTTRRAPGSNTNAGGRLRALRSFFFFMMRVMSARGLRVEPWLREDAKELPVLLTLLPVSVP